MPPTPTIYRPSTAILSLGPNFYDPVEAASFPKTILRFRNDRAAASIGLQSFSDAEWISHFGRFVPLPGTLQAPLALRYHGHQFRTYNPEIGDGRGFTFAQMLDQSGRLMDLGTKGSGRTPWSRFGDGRLTLKGGVREILASEMLEALGVPTSRTLSLIETGEELQRGDEPSPTRSSVLVRLSHGHIRIGSFQRLAYMRDFESMARLVSYTLTNLYGESSDDPVLLLDHVVRRSAAMAARYMAAGFVHGVLNSDNINVTGESFDYGPWRFLPNWDRLFTAAYFDHSGLYAFGRQPEAIAWDVMQLAVSLRGLVDSDPLIAAVERFGSHYQSAMIGAMIWRLGVVAKGDDHDQRLVNIIERTLESKQVALDQFFFDAFGGSLPQSYGPEWAEVRVALSAYHARKSRDSSYWASEPCSMLIEEVEAIWAAISEADDWQPLYRTIEAIREMGAALA